MHRKLIFILALCTFAPNLNAQDVGSQLRQIANDLAKQIEAKGKK